MLPLRDNHVLRSPAVVTWTLAVLNLAIFSWDRSGSLFGSASAFVDLSLKPYEVAAFAGGHADPLIPAKVFTSMFLHANLWHLGGNLLVLLVFGPSVEQALGGPRYGALYLLAGIAAAAAHVWVYPGSFSGLLGASGAIGGVMGAYFLLFPAAKIRCWAIFDTFEVPAWLLLSLWFVGQLFVSQTGTANWAHVGGCVVGMAAVLALGGRSNILASNPVEDVPSAP